MDTLGTAQIRKLNQFARLSSADKKVLVRMSEQHVRHFKAREDIIREGEKPEMINLIQQGWACRYKVLEDGRRQIIAFFLPGDLSDLNIFTLREMDHSIGAITPVTLSEIARGSFDELMLAYPRLAQALWWELLVNTAIQREWTVNLGRRDAFERMAHLFCELFMRLKAAGMTKGKSCEMPLTQNDLGEATGLSTVHVNRTLQALRAEGLLSWDGMTAEIQDRERLMRFAQFDPAFLHLYQRQR